MQPVRQKIKDAYPNAAVKPFYTLIIDGNNLLRQSMVDSKVNADGLHYGGIFQFFLQIRMLLTGEYRYDYVYVVFDDTDSGILRYKIYNEYKANRDKNYARHLMDCDGGESEYWKRLNRTIKGMEKAIYNKTRKRERMESLDEEKRVEMERRRAAKELVDENFERERNIIMMYCVEMSIRVLFDDKTEGDDFIAYYVNHKRPEERIIIVSTDQDLTQLISPTVAVYNRDLKKYLNVKNFKKIKGYPIENVVLRKIMCGDTSDNIGNIKGLSESRLMELMPEISERPVTVSEVRERAREKVSEREAEGKKPLQWHLNIINGVSNKVYEGDFYAINEQLIDLRKPLLTKQAETDIESMMYAPMEPDDNSFKNLFEMVRKDKIEDVMDPSHFSRFFQPFKELSDKEKRRYIEYTAE